MVIRDRLIPNRSTRNARIRNVRVVDPRPAGRLEVAIHAGFVILIPNQYCSQAGDDGSGSVRSEEARWLPVPANAGGGRGGRMPGRAKQDDALPRALQQGI